MNTTSLGRARAFPIMVAAVVAVGWYATGVAGAGISPFTVSPASGPPGTVVSVSGEGCAPGLTRSASSDFVAVNGTILQTTMRIPVAPNGSWHGSFTVPDDADSGPGSLGSPVVALCFSDGLPSFTTLYTPQTFTVTAPPAPTTTVPGGTTSTTPTTKPPNDTGNSTPPTHGTTPPDTGPGSPVPVFGGFPPNSTDSGGGSGDTGSGADASDDARPGSVKADVGRATGGARAARAADLDAPELLLTRLRSSSGLGWVSWLLLLALAVSAIAAPLWLRRSPRSGDDGAAVGDVSRVRHG